MVKSELVGITKLNHVLQGACFESMGIQGEQAYRKLHITTFFKMWAYFLTNVKDTVCFDRLIQLENGGRCTSDTLELLRFAVS